MKRVLILAGVAALLTQPLYANSDDDHAGDHEDAAVVLDASVEDGDVAAGEEVYQGVCKNCHGPTAKGMASFPKLAGLAPEHLVARLLAYKAEEKVGPNSALMYPVAQDLSDEDIANVVAYIDTTFK